jgi:hypothetical protein
MMLELQAISVNIARSLQDVAAYLQQPSNFPHWADGLGKLTEKLSDLEWLADTPVGQVRVCFSQRNDYGVADHWVTLPDGTEIAIPVRAIANGEGATVSLTLFRQPSMTDSDFARDRGMVEKDLATLKNILER